VSTRKSVAGVLTPARTLVVTSVVGVVVALLSLMVVQAASRPAHAAADRLPDLGMARFKALQTQRTNDGRRLLRFSSIIVNVGAGRFELRGWRRGTGTNTMKVKQRIYNDAGGWASSSTSRVSPREIQAQGRGRSSRLVQGEKQRQQLHLGQHPTYEERCEDAETRSRRLESRSVRYRPLEDSVIFAVVAADDASRLSHCNFRPLSV
jgi:hypothetical protein